MTSPKRGRLRGLLLWGAGAIGVLSCQQQTTDIPNRVLDRPIDMALACVHIECDSDGECHGEAASLRECRGEVGACGQSGNRLVGFVANSERNEVALFTQCSGELVDMDLEAPGYNFIPVGELPSAMASTTDGCRVISANAGSCDLGVLDAPNLGAFGFDIRSPTRLTPDGGRVPVEPASLVSNVVPERLDPDLGWVPLAARPANIIPVPPQLSTSGSGLAPDDPILDVCGPDQPGSVYVSFPSCDLVAEVDLVSHRILQSFQFEETEDGIEITETGSSPVCPVDCPDLFDGDLPDGLPPADTEGVAPNAIELVNPPFGAGGDCTGDDDPCTDFEDCLVEDSALFVGGLGSDFVVEIPIEEDGTWNPLVRSLELVGAAGVERIRVTPVTGDEPEFNDLTNHQFLYVITGDGSTRVVHRNLGVDRSEIGTECDTQVDPLVGEGDPVCYPVTQTPVGVAPPDRRSFANGPGIRAPGGSRVTDWAFKKVPANPLECLNFDGLSPEIGLPGDVLGVGTTNAGRLVFATFGQFDQGQIDQEVQKFDPLATMDVGIRWHMLWPEFPPIVVTGTEGDVELELLALPTVTDVAPNRAFPDDSGPLAALSPGLRLIDWAYFYSEEDKGTGNNDAITLGTAYGIQNVDGLGGPNALETGSDDLYREDVVRAISRDYRAWFGGLWELVWEGSIPGATSSTGQFKCRCECGDSDQCPEECDWGWEDSTCQASQPDSSRLVDLGADFCNAGVLPGDKLVIVGCAEDNDCGPGQKCLISPGGVPGSGICISEQTFQEDEQRLRQVCDHYINDPCGEPYREFLITRAFQNELWLQVLDVDPIAYLAEDPDAVNGCEGVADDEECFPALIEREDRFECNDEQPEGGCDLDEDCRELEGCAVLDEEGNPTDESECLCIEKLCRKPCECLDPQPDQTCEMDSDCDGEPECQDGECFCDPDGQCARECLNYDCLVRRLPGPACFQEFTRYQVRAHNQFLVSGAGATNFLSDQVFADPDSVSPHTGGLECYLAGAEAGVSSLLTSRIPLGATEDDIDLPVCDTGVPNSGSPNPCLITQNRSSDASSLFHYFTYGDQGGEDPADVTAIRYSNPVMTVILDLTDLRALGTRIPDGDREPVAGLNKLAPLWPTAFHEFRRSRIPRGYRQEFSTTPGYSAKNFVVGIGRNLLTFPTRIISSPDLNWAFIVDGSGPGTSTSIRGQVLRVDVSSNPPLADIGFDGVR